MCIIDGAIYQKSFSDLEGVCYCCIIKNRYANEVTDIKEILFNIFMTN